MSKKKVGLPCLGLVAALLSGVAAATQDEGHGAQQSTLLLAQANAGQPQPVGQPPPEREPEKTAPNVQAIAELGGVLTPRGTLVVTPSLQVSTSQVNQFNFEGVSLVNAVLVGFINAENTDRDFVQAALSFRLGLTNRLEISVKVPYIYRHQTGSFTLVSQKRDKPQGPSVQTVLEEGGLGDVELSLSYQINGASGGGPIFVANLRYKSTTGEGPFEVARGPRGLPTELATGSGFRSIEPSLTILLRSDPAVFYANVGYLFNLPKDVDKTIGTGDQARRIGKVDPGNALRVSFGMAYAINRYASFNLGYKNDYIFPTTTEINGVTLESNRLEIGALLLGFSYAISPRVSANLSMQFGVTADATDVMLTFQLPIAFAL